MTYDSGAGRHKDGQYLNGGGGCDVSTGVDQPVVVLVHGSCAESAIWAGVIRRLAERGVSTVAFANPLRGVAEDAAKLGSLITTLDQKVILAGHCYGGMVTTAAAVHPAVKALVYVSAYAPAPGESAALLTSKFEGSTLADTLIGQGGGELIIDPDKFHEQYAADLPYDQAAMLAATQRPIAERAMDEPLDTDEAAWQWLPSWFIWGGAGRSIPAEALRFMADRAGGMDCYEIPNASHATPVSRAAAVTESILEATAYLER
jgi:pimeloyl-ACP methyl ester carboxylesterase